MFNVFTVDEFEREMTIAEKAYDIAMSEVAYLEAMIDAKLKINMAKSEYKVMTESTAETAQGDLVYLYNEAGKEQEASQEGLFTKVKNAVISFFVSAWNAIQKVFTKVDTEAYKKLKGKVTFPMDVKFLADKGSTLADALDDVEPSDSKIVKIAKIVGAVGVTAGGIAGINALINHTKEAVHKETTVDGSEVEGIVAKLRNIFPKFSNAAKNLKPDTDGDKEGVGTKILDFIKSIGGWISNAINVIVKKVGGAATAAGESVKKLIKGKEAEPESGYTNADKKEDDSLLKNGMQPKVFKGVKYAIDKSTGKVTFKDKDGTWKESLDNNTPEEIKDLAMRVKGKAHAAASNTDEPANNAESKVWKNAAGDIIKFSGKTGRAYIKKNGSNKAEAIDPSAIPNYFSKTNKTDRNVAKTVKDFLKNAKVGESVDESENLIYDLNEFAGIFEAEGIYTQIIGDDIYLGESEDFEVLVDYFVLCEAGFDVELV